MEKYAHFWKYVHTFQLLLKCHKKYAQLLHTFQLVLKCHSERMVKRNQGRIRPHQRDTDDTAPTIGAELELPEGLDQALNQTTKHDIDDACRKNYRQRLTRIINFWQAANDPDYYQLGVRDVSEEDLEDESLFYFNKYNRDIMYQGMRTEFVTHFLVKNTFKDNNKLKSEQDLRTYKDAIMWGAKTAKERLPTRFFEMFDSFLEGYKKEFIVQKKIGNVDSVVYS